MGTLENKLTNFLRLFHDDSGMILTTLGLFVASSLSNDLNDWNGKRESRTAFPHTSGSRPFAPLAVWKHSALHFLVLNLNEDRRQIERGWKPSGGSA